MNNQNQEKESNVGPSQVFRNALLENLGRMIMEERRRRNLRLAVFAKEIGVRVETLERLELGRAPINWECLRRVAHCLGKKVEIRLTDVI
ncbi:MAG: helix-turn-helix transcriptional regulator [Acetobacter sp.]|nr:helix-turn-helix transcriptional regulator [Acetobacter sp.]